MKFLLFGLACLISFYSFCQNEKSDFTKFGKITIEDLQKKVYTIDSNANAVILSDMGKVALEGNSKGWFSIVSERHKVVHILNKNGYEEASVEIPLYVDGRDEEKVTNLKAVTYNLENGEIVETKMEKSGQFKESVDKNHRLVKFTMPQVKEGSIIEYQYEVTSDFISILDPWYFQSLTAPTLWSEFTFSVPQFFSYNFLNRGYLPMSINERKDRTGNFRIADINSYSGKTEHASFSAGVSDFRWVVKNAPELKKESYTSSLRNHISRMEFQLASQSNPLTPHNFRTTWQEVMKGLLESESFGMKLNSSNGWMSEEVKPLFKDLDNNTEKARKIFYYVRDHFTSTNEYGVFMDQTLKNVFKTKKGSVAEINLLLTAMLRYADIEAYPVLLSTTDHGYSFEFSPMINSMNYVVVQCKDQGKTYYLDASQPRLGFGRLLENAYNGHARIANKDATPVYFQADSLREKKTTLLSFVNKENGKWEGGFIQTPGFYESLHTRNIISEKGKEEFFKEIQKQYNTFATVQQPSIDSLSNLETPLTVKYNLEFNNDNEEILYFNPTLNEGYKKNPFVAEERNYPVEMPYASEEVIIETIEVPNGYVVDELPKQMLLKLDEEGKTFFEYRIEQSGNRISFLNRIKIHKAMFLPEEYPMLREFFNIVVKKQSEQIVFKKKK
jgi:transglutaminase-like putative cysteine protease